MARAFDLQTLLKYPDESRNEEWERIFFLSLIESNLKLDSSDPHAGPDGWPYLFAVSDPAATEPATKIFDWLSTRGIGLVLNPYKQVPDYIFTYGMIWNYRERGQFITPMEREVVAGHIHFDTGQKVLAGAPSASYLPEYVKSILRQFLKAQGVKDPRILVLSRDQQDYDLCFSLEAMGNPPKHEHAGIAEALSWFLPGHYSIMLVAEEGLPEFHSL